uniref:K Homology domain-containing protein n=1 Tax=Ciona savignyi TaxID=51511 RepID=H2YHF6_CIOSA
MMEQMEEGNEMAHSSMGQGPGVANFPIHIMNWNTQEVTVGNDVMGSIIGKGGSRIKEIRTISGAQIWINKVENEEDKKLADDVERKITIQGTPEAITLAHYLINLSVSMYGGDAGSLLGQPPANNAYGNMGYMGQGGPMNDFNSAMMSAKHALLTSSNYRAPKMRHRMGSNNSKSDAPQGDAIEEADMSGNTSPNGKERRKNKREKFQPY